MCSTCINIHSSCYQMCVCLASKWKRVCVPAATLLTHNWTSVAHQQHDPPTRQQQAHMKRVRNGRCVQRSACARGSRVRQVCVTASCPQQSIRSSPPLTGVKQVNSLEVSPSVHSLSIQVQGMAVAPDGSHVQRKTFPVPDGECWCKGHPNPRCTAFTPEGRMMVGRVSPGGCHCASWRKPRTHA